MTNKSVSEDRINEIVEKLTTAVHAELDGPIARLHEAAEKSDRSQTRLAKKLRKLTKRAAKEVARQVATTMYEEDLGDTVGDGGSQPVQDFLNSDSDSDSDSDIEVRKEDEAMTYEQKQDYRRREMPKNYIRRPRGTHSEKLEAGGDPYAWFKSLWAMNRDVQIQTGEKKPGSYNGKEMPDWFKELHRLDKNERRKSGESFL